MKKYMLNRKMYKNIKKMDHIQMSGFLESIYKEGYVAGQKETKGLTAEEVKEAILKIKGIGEKRVGSIIAALEEKLGSESD